MPVMRIPFTDPLPLPRILPPSAAHASGAIAALAAFLNAPPSHRLRPFPSAPDTAAAPVSRDANSTLLLTGAGISVASGLADYRGTNGTYTLNKTYRPIYYNEFVANHAARKRYWARSFLGWTSLARAKPNSSHWAVRDLGEMGVVRGVITQTSLLFNLGNQAQQFGFWHRFLTLETADVDSFHPTAHPSLQTLELHGYLRALVCLSCRHEYPRDAFQQRLAALNPAWAAFLDEMLASGALSTENPDERRRRGLKTNPDGDVDVTNVDYASFRYPACPVCLEKAASGGAVATGKVDVDADGAWLESSTAGVLKPAVIMFGESIPGAVKQAAEDAVDGAGRLLVVGSSLATYSAWRLVKRAKEQGMPIGILNIGGVRGEDVFLEDVPKDNDGRWAVRSAENSDAVLPGLVERLTKLRGIGESAVGGVKAGASI
ncbi:hypothetical protein SLS56_002727 [Neofusicoccum ribis]|uniref:Deacetylase sirtuin-type domain-containing protein n=1 Tax=Neofusicoccum ribis TaxID=45134 RepID=A0ABR3T3D2_9PEZI